MLHQMPQEAVTCQAFCVLVKFEVSDILDCYFFKKAHQYGNIMARGIEGLYCIFAPPYLIPFILNKNMCKL